jgi:hypothetical protein
MNRDRHHRRKDHGQDGKKHKPPCHPGDDSKKGRKKSRGDKTKKKPEPDIGCAEERCFHSTTL